MEQTGDVYPPPARSAWWAGLRCNDPNVIRALYKQDFPAVRAYVTQNNGTVHDAEDMFQDAVAVLWFRVKEGSLQDISDPGAFLFRVAKNKWLDRLRSAAHKHMRVVSIDRMAEQVAEEADDIEERIARLRVVYDKLDDKCRAVLDQFYFERKALSTIAAGMHVEEESIRTIKYRCMMKLRAFCRTISGADNEAI